MNDVSLDLERICHPEILPLEISDLPVENATLWEWSQGPGFSTALSKALKLLHEGGNFIRLGEGVLTSVADFDAVFVTGGRSSDADLRDELSRLPWSITFDVESTFGGKRGGFELLQCRGLSGWVADLGKSQLKIATPKQHWIVPRNWNRLPPAGLVTKSAVASQRRRLREFIALSLQLARTETGACPQALVFGLPCRLNDKGVPASSSYAGMRDDETLLIDALKIAGIVRTSLLVLNDAELAAHSARLDPRLAGYRKILVLTLGFGIGAALIHRAG